MLQNADIVNIYRAAQSNIRNTAEFLRAKDDIINGLKHKAEYADPSPMILKDLGLGIRQALHDDFRNAGFHVHCFDHNSISVGMSGI